ncbi:MAG: VWA domain-containing protein [Polyangiaceae bacterium]
MSAWSAIRWSGLAVLASSVAVACSAESGDSTVGPGQGSGASGSGGSPTINVGGNGNGVGATGGLDESACAAETAKAEQVALDLYVMMDTSGSMEDATQAGPTKWDAIKQAVSAFAADPLSGGLNVGLQFFPQTKQGVPSTCSSNAACGSAGPCLLRACAGSSSLMPCSSSTECGAYGPCLDLGECSANPGALCMPAGSTGGSCGSCMKLTQSECLNATSCDIGGYAAPQVAFAPLSANGAQITAAMQARSPSGNTPTGPALAGALQHAKARAAQYPDHKVVVVMATDGLPTSCDPLKISDVSQIAAQGQSGSPSVGTFVIGVFGPKDASASSNLNAIAQAGGTNAAFIVDTSQDVAKQFRESLDTIAGTALPCEYKVPIPGSGEALDYAKVNVKFTKSGNSAYVGYVASAAQCDPAHGGWYYDVDPSQGGTPKRLVMCPATCDAFKGTRTGSVDILMGCQTLTGPPR